MIFREWSHGHSLASGVLGGLLLTDKAWTVAVIAFSLGLLAGLLGHLAWAAAERLGEGSRRVRLSTPVPPVAYPPRLYNREVDEELVSGPADFECGWTRTPW